MVCVWLSAMSFKWPPSVNTGGSWPSDTNTSCITDDICNKSCKFHFWQKCYFGENKNSNILC